MVKAIPILAEQPPPLAVEAELARPYAPSWVDRLTDWVRQLPVPDWLFYAMAGLGLYMVSTLLKWYDGTLPPGTIYPLHVVFAGVTAYMLAVIPFLDGVADRALQKTRPALTLSDAEYARLRYELTVAPARPMLVANTIAVLFMTAQWLIFFDSAFLELGKFGITPASKLADIALTYTNLIVLSAFVYHTIHQLRHVRRIYASYVEVDLFQTGPLFAFSTLTARTAFALLAANYTMLAAFVLASPVLASSLGPVAATFITTTTAIMVFAWPLLDLHNRMKVEKQELLDRNSSEMKIVFTEKRRHLETGDLHEVGPLKNMVDTLVAERAVLEKLPTWPWQNATVRGFSTALLLPVLLWLIQRILERLFNF